MTRIILAAVTCLQACGDSSADGFDAGGADGTTTDAKGADAEPLADALSAVDADPSACLPNNLWNVVADRAIVVGDYCDDIQLCAVNTAAAATIMAIEPGFTCGDPPAPGPAGCATGERYCVWFDPDVVDADDYASLCEITVLENAPEQLRCLLYLP